MVRSGKITLPSVSMCECGEPKQIHTAFLFYRISIEPAHEDGVVEAVAVVIEVGLGIIILC